MGCNVVAFNPAAASVYKSPQGASVYHNLRAEAWSKAAKILSSGMLDEESNMVFECKNMYQSLATELCAPSYKFAETGGKILVESKKDLKSPKRLGKSPDHADTFVIGLWAWDLIDYITTKFDGDVGYMTKKRERKVGSPMRMC